MASDNVSGILQNKLKDIAVIFSAYEKYLEDSNVSDQSSALARFPSLAENLERVKDSNVFVVGYTGLTKQNLLGIEALIKVAKSFTAILPSGENGFAFVNETVCQIENIANKLNKKVVKVKEKTPFSKEGEIITSKLFNPLAKAEKTSTDKIKILVAKSEDEEAEKIASIIKKEVMEGKRYKDFTVVLPSPQDGVAIKKAFTLLKVPYYLDTEYRVDNHPLITLIFSYLDIFIKNLERETVLSLIKNPLYLEDKTLADAFINYVYKFNINYSMFSRPFTLELDDKQTFLRIEQLRKKLAEDVKSFNISSFLKNNNIQEKLALFSAKLKQANSFEEAAVTEQIYSKITDVTKEMNDILGEVLDVREFKTVLSAGISAMKLSIIPQYNDAVFIGGFKECARALSKNLFVCRLTSSVPGIKEDTALLSDGELDRLMDLKVIIEPKIKIVNHRVREEILVALASFSDNLYLSYSVNASGGEKNVKSEVVKFFENNFTLLPFPETERYLTDSQGLRNFSADCSDFAEWGKGDIIEAISFQHVEKEGKAKKVLESANGETVQRIPNVKVLVSPSISPTTVEEFYKCPFRSFMGHALGVKEREIGEVSSLAIGNVMHDIFYLFVKGVKSVNGEEEARELFNNCKEKVLNVERYQKYLNGDGAQINLSMTIEECEKHCLNTYNFLKNSSFKAEEENLEKKFEIPLADGKVKLGGKIDRIDTFSNYFRVIDYKTGKVDDSDEGLFYGTKLQLWLYALSVKDKQLAGAYYYDAKDEYQALKYKGEPVFKGKTLAIEEVVKMQDGSIGEDGQSSYLPVTVKGGVIKGGQDERTLSALLKYAEKMCENAVREMNSGTIIASPVSGACEWCKYKSVCLVEEGSEREINKVKEESIVQAVYGGEENA